jgi:hypothetical protein
MYLVFGPLFTRTHNKSTALQNKILQLTAAERAKGVICNSAGNHAQAVSHHATRLGIDGLIVMPGALGVSPRCLFLSVLLCIASSLFRSTTLSAISSFVC